MQLLNKTDNLWLRKCLRHKVLEAGRLFWENMLALFLHFSPGICFLATVRQIIQLHGPFVSICFHISVLSQSILDAEHTLNSWSPCCQSELLKVLQIKYIWHPLFQELTSSSTDFHGNMHLKFSQGLGKLRVLALMLQDHNKSICVFGSKRMPVHCVLSHYIPGLMFLYGFPLCMSCFLYFLPTSP